MQFVTRVHLEARGSDSVSESIAVCVSAPTKRERFGEPFGDCNEYTFRAFKSHMPPSRQLAD